MGILVILNLLFSIAALIVGFFAGVWFYKTSSRASLANANTTSQPAKSEKPQPVRTAAPAQPTSTPRDSTPPQVETIIATERVATATQKIQDLTQGIVVDVGAHSSKVEAVTADLRTLTVDRSNNSESMLNAVARIVESAARLIEANTQLQDRLVVADKQIESQAVELRTSEAEARTDSLTGLANRRAFDDEIRRSFAEWQRRRTPFTLMFLDLDHFKQLNDTHGHPAGDAVLQCVSHVLQKGTRQTDLLCRYGGEEFAIVMPATDIAQAQLTAERFRKAVETASTTVDGKRLTVTASVGTASVVGQDDVTRLIRRADEAMYKSKDAGRNCSHWHDGTRCVPVVLDAAASTSTPAKSTDAKRAASLEQLQSPAEFIAVLEHRVEESQRYGIPLSVMHLRINDYATIGERYGRATAQLVLTSMAEYAQAALRDMDILARLEDGEFVALLPGSTFYEATQVARRLHAAVATSSVPITDDKLSLHMTHGIAQRQRKESATDLLNRAKEENEPQVSGEKLAAV